MILKTRHCLFLKRDNFLKKYLLITPLIFLSGCSDNAITKLYDKEFSNPSCLRAVVFPPDSMIKITLEELYSFDETCEYKLQVSKKDGITCNSTHNADKKNRGNFPSGYLKMDVMKGSKTLYSYYIDLKDSPTKSDVKNGFARVKKDLKIN